MNVAALLIASVLCLTKPTIARSDEPSVDDVTLLRDLRYREGTHRHWALDLAMLKTPPERPQPAIVVIHGGGWIEGDKSSFSSAKNRMPGNIIDLAKQGFVAVTINYRLSGEAQFPAAVHDCQCAVRWLRAHAREYQVDPARIAAYGNSAGGHLALLLAMTQAAAEPQENGPWQEQSSQVQAAVSDSGPIDLMEQYEQGTLRSVVSQFLGGPPDGARAAEYKRASPASHITKQVPPLLLIYGVQDNQVPVRTADRFVLALDEAGVKDVSYHRLAGSGHCPHSLGRVPWLEPVVNEFFVRTLRSSQSGPARDSRNSCRHG